MDEHLGGSMKRALVVLVGLAVAGCSGGGTHEKTGEGVCSKSSFTPPDSGAPVVGVVVRVVRNGKPVTRSMAPLELNGPPATLSLKLSDGSALSATFRAGGISSNPRIEGEMTVGAKVEALAVKAGSKSSFILDSMTSIEIEPVPAPTQASGVETPNRIYCECHCEAPALGCCVTSPLCCMCCGTGCDSCECPIR